MSMRSLIAFGAVIFAGCADPKPQLRVPDPAPQPVLTETAAPSSVAKREPVHVTVGDWGYITVEGVTRAVVSQGDRVIAIRGGDEHQAITVEGLAAGQGVIAATNAEGQTLEIAVEVVDGRDGACPTRSVPVLGLVVAPEKNVARWQQSGNGAGTLAIGDEALVTFERAGVLLTQSWDRDDRRQCTLYVADDPLSCASTIKVSVGAVIQMPLSEPQRTWRLVGHDAAEITPASTEKKLVIAAKEVGRAALWTHNTKSEWVCNVIDVTP